MKKDRERWDKRFQERPLKAPKPPGFIKACVSDLNRGSVLDIACGDGASALWLAQQGFEVTASDISEVALARISTFADASGVHIATHAADLDAPNQFEDLGHFDNIVITHFKPQLQYWPIFVSLLNPGGKLLLSTFNLKHHEIKGFSQRFCLRENELVNVHEALSLAHHASVSRNGDHMDDYLFIRS